MIHLEWVGLKQVLTSKMDRRLLCGLETENLILVGTDSLQAAGNKKPTEHRDYGSLTEVFCFFFCEI